MDPDGLKIHDAVYGIIRFPAYVRVAVESIEFMRLKSLKQLGVSDIIFETAVHSRYDHSLGACYLAGRLLDTLDKTLECPLRDDERKCVLLAAVLHDVGHGPFSHMWEKFVKAYGVQWKHENASVLVSQTILESMKNVTEKQVNLICSLIRGNAAELLSADRLFLANIVSSDVDVDRCDYLQRDAHYVKGIINPSRPFWVLFDRARTVMVHGNRQLAFHWEDYALVHEMACARQTFHRLCYQNSRVLGIELMMLDVMHEAERAGFHFCRNGLSEPLSKVHTKPELFVRLYERAGSEIVVLRLDFKDSSASYLDMCDTGCISQGATLFKYLDDNIVDELATSNYPRLERAKEIIHRIRSGQLYEEIIRFLEDKQQEVEDYNSQQGGTIVVQGERFIKSTKQWFSGFNVTFYKPDADGHSFEPLSTDEARRLNPVDECGASEKVEEYIIYCTSIDPKVQEHARSHFKKLLEQTINGS